MHFDQRIVAGLGGVLTGAVLAYAAGTATRADLEAQLARQGDTLASVAAVDAALASLDERVDSGMADMAVRIDGLAAKTADAAALQVLTDRVERLSAEIPGAVSGMGSKVRAAMAGDLAALSAQMAALVQPVPAAVAAAAEEPAPAPAARGEAVAIRLGQALPVSDRIRVFLSGVDPEAGTARVAVNGTRTATLRAGQATAQGDCDLTLTGFEGRTAFFTGTCPDATAAAAPVHAAAADPAETPEGSIRIGQTALLADGGLRVYLSSVNAEEGVARVAINGFRSGPVVLGMPVEVGSCSLVLTHAAPGVAAFDGTCDAGGAPSVIPAVATSEAVPAATGGAPLRIGETTVIDEALRVFLSAVDPEEGTARVAINGTGLTTLATALPHPAGDCSVHLVGIEGRSATISGSC